MFKILTIFYSFAILLPLYAQESDSSAAPRSKPIMSEQPVIFDRSSIAGELEALQQPVIPAGEVVVEKDRIETRFNDHEARKLFIPEVEIDDVKRYWTRILRKNGESKVRTDGNRMTVSGLLLEDISATPFEAEVQYEQLPEGVNVWIALEQDSVALTSRDEPSLFSALEGFLLNEGKVIYRDFINEEISAEEKVLQDMERDYDRLIRDNERFH
ncbi:MAG: hypothetical protein P8X57_08675, partial [Cyclobacteriaceae bacterium]